MWQSYLKRKNCKPWKISCDWFSYFRTILHSKGVDGMGLGEVSVITQIRDAGEKAKRCGYLIRRLRIFGSKFDFLRDTHSKTCWSVKWSRPNSLVFLTKCFLRPLKTPFWEIPVDGWTQSLQSDSGGEYIGFIWRLERLITLIRIFGVAPWGGLKTGGA